MQKSYRTLPYLTVPYRTLPRVAESGVVWVGVEVSMGVNGCHWTTAQNE